MKIRFLAADSMGVRSLALQVETEEAVITVDPGASLAPRRYGLPPHPKELKELEHSLDRIRSAIRESDIVIITHYHYDHYVRGEPELYRGKILLVKHPRKDINRSQAIRSYRLLKKEGVEDIAREVVYADSSTYELEGLRIEFSSPVWHGYPGTKVGKVIMVRIMEDDNVIIYTSDAQGPADPEAVRILTNEWSYPRPDLIVIDGPPTYFAGFKVPVEHVEAGLRGMLEVIKRAKPRVAVVDHHLLRDINYREKITDHIEEANLVGVKLLTAACYMGREPNLLEARRKELWRESQS